jgi:hypothetical protein
MSGEWWVWQLPLAGLSQEIRLGHHTDLGHAHCEKPKAYIDKYKGKYDPACRQYD